MRIAHTLTALLGASILAACGSANAPKSLPPAPAPSTPAETEAEETPTEEVAPEPVTPEAPPIAEAPEAPVKGEPTLSADEARRQAQIAGTLAPKGKIAALTGSAGPASDPNDRDVYGGLLGDEVGSTSPYSAELNLVSSKGGLDKKSTEAVLGLVQVDLDNCTNEKDAIEQGAVRLRFRINAKGRTSKVVAKGGSKTMAKCMRAVVLLLHFAESKKATTVVATVTPVVGSGGWGYGISGVGPGGGGTGWGTIGTGKYGTIGHGGGTGTGYGSGSGGSGSRPQVSIGATTSAGSLDKNIIRRYMRRKLPRIRHCYEKELLVKPKLSGTVRVKFVIAASGSVDQISAVGLDPVVSKCVAATVKSIQFPKPKGGGIVSVNYPFKFVPKVK